METITSKDNPLIKEARRLLQNAKARRESGRFVIEGSRLCGDAALSGVALRAVLLTERAEESYPEVAAALRRACGDCRRISEELARQLGDTVAPQGVFCVCEALDNCRPFGTIKKNTRLLGLENIQDPANLGAVIRTAEALGLDGLLLSGCCDVTSPKVLRGSMGGVFRLPLYLAGRMDEAVASLRKGGWRCLACVPDPSAAPVQGAALGPGTLCLIGNEGNGLTPETVAACDGRITIPMGGRAESLNASMAAGIILWELMRPQE